MVNRKIAAFVIVVAGLLCLTPWVPAAAALVAGIAIAVVFGNPFAEFTKANTSRLLAWSVMGLGAGMNLLQVVRVGGGGFVYTVIGISSTLALGFILSRLFKVEREAGILITVGTAICGGSAIAAVAPTINAKSQNISVALGTVFLLNASALLIFPAVGHWLGLTQTQFGLWSALAIHDTSSVVGATLQYGSEALQIGTTVKLARALWIVPLTVACSFIFAHGKESHSKPKRPWFILGFVVAAAIVTWIPAAQPLGHLVETAAKRALVLTLFFIGANLTPATLKSVGVRPFLLGLGLWAVVASATLAAIEGGWIH